MGREKGGGVNKNVIKEKLACALRSIRRKEKEGRSEHAKYLYFKGDFSFQPHFTRLKMMVITMGKKG